VLAKPAVLDELAAGTLAALPVAAPRLQTKLMLATAVRRPITRGIRLVEQEIKTLVAELVAEKPNKFGLSLIPA
jgi:LysR family nitrogen assimilation transcriptional regulator